MIEARLSFVSLGKANKLQHTGVGVKNKSTSAYQR